MITLRKNQEEPIQKAIDFFKAKNPAPSLIVLPTAWGKSILTAFVAKNTTEKLLVLQPSKELLEQNYRKYIDLCEFEMHAGIYSASFNRREIAQITYATIGSIKSLGARFRQMGFTKMLIDEAHLYPREAESMLGRFLKDSGITHILGITATPIKLQNNRDASGETFSKLVMLTSRSKKGNFFREIIHVGQVQEMVDLGFWSKLSYQNGGFDGRLLEYNSAKSEYTEESVQLAYEANNVTGSITQALDANTDRRHILVFVPSVAEAIAFSKKYPNSGVVYGEMDKKARAHTIAEFRAGRLRVIFNVRVLSTGFDYTGIDCIILGISTASIALYYQIIGRATRIAPGKTDALIIDFGGNVDRFGRVEDLTFEKKTIWRLYGTGGVLLSGIPIHQIGTISRKTVEEIEERKTAPINEMPWGKHKGTPLREVPEGYRKWCLENITWTRQNENLKQAIQSSLTA